MRAQRGRDDLEHRSQERSGIAVTRMKLRRLCLSSLDIIWAPMLLLVSPRAWHGQIAS
jgi:hypothetical protein